MSASTVSITANTATAARRTPVVSNDKRSNLDFPASESLLNGGVREGTSRDLIRAEAVVERSPSNSVPVVRKTVSSATGINVTAAATQRRTRKVAAPKPPGKPRWKKVVRIFAKQLAALVLLAGLIHLTRKVILRAENPFLPPSFGSEMAFSELEGRIAEVDGFVKSATKMIQVQVEVLDKKLDKEAKSLRHTIDESGSAFQTELNKIESRTDRLVKSVDDLNAQTWVSKDELERIYEELKKGKDDESAVSDINLDEVRAYARDVVEKAIEKHAADGLGRVDYALASGGASVIKHSDPYMIGKGSVWSGTNRVHSNAIKMLSPSFGDPGQCFPLKGSNGYVQVRLRAPIMPEAVTLEHVAKSVAYDRSSAPKDCRVSGWFQGADMEPAVDAKKMILLTDFMYDLHKSNAQTFDVIDSARSSLVDTIRLDFTSNHGNAHHTCIYRLRVHGRETDGVSAVPTKA